MAELDVNADLQPSVTQAPVLSTPAEHLFEDPTPVADSSARKSLTEKELYDVYEISRTVQLIRDGQYKRVALQFPDRMLQHATKVYRALEKDLTTTTQASKQTEIARNQLDDLAIDFSNTTLLPDQTIKLFILADTSYSSCCADEIAAEHVSADVIIHYGRACLSPTARLPVIHVFTQQPVNLDQVVAEFATAFPSESGTKVVLVADLPLDWCLADLKKLLVEEKGYKEDDISVTKPTRDPSASIPNRTSPPPIQTSATETSPQQSNESSSILSGYSLFHLGTPPTALLLTLSSQITPPSTFTVFDPTSPTSSPTPLSTSQRLLRRRYAQISRLPSTPILGILTAAPSSSALLPTLKVLTEKIKAAGKKSYLISVGKMTPAKVANFSEVGIWIVVGCWESSLVDNEGAAFMAPMVTAWEAIMALEGRLDEVWKGIWRGEVDVETNAKASIISTANETQESQEMNKSGERDGDKHEWYDEDEDEEEPEYDFRTGRLVTKARPMRPTRKPNPSTAVEGIASSSGNAGALIKQSQDSRQLAKIGGVVSPGAEFLRENRTWQGLGSEFETDFTTSTAENGALVEEGRSGVARGYANEPGKDTVSS